MNAFADTKTSRLVIRPIVPDDWRGIHRYMSNPEVTTYLPNPLPTEEAARAFAEKNAGPEREAYAVDLLGSRELIGHIVFHPWFAPRTYELGWVLDMAHQGHGYATEAARALLAHAFEILGAHRVIATCQPENRASSRIMEKLGMRQEAHFRRCNHRGGDVWWDELFFAMLEEEYRAQLT